MRCGMALVMATGCWSSPPTPASEVAAPRPARTYERHEPGEVEDDRYDDALPKNSHARPLVIASPSDAGVDARTGDPFTSPRGSPVALVAAQPEPARMTEHRDSLVIDGKTVLELFDHRDYVMNVLCVRDRAQLVVHGDTRIVLTSGQTSVIGGAGIRPAAGEKRVRIDVVGAAPEVFVLFDNAAAPIQAEFHAAQSKVHIAITGKTGLDVTGELGTANYYAAWGLPSTFPTCAASATLAH